MFVCLRDVASLAALGLFVSAMTVWADILAILH